MEYQSPVIELTELEAEDVLCSSASPLTLKFNLSRSSSLEDPTPGWGGTETEF